MILYFITAIFLILGVAFTIAAICIWIFGNRKTEKCTEKVLARIEDLHKVERMDIDRDGYYVTYYPIYRYEYLGTPYVRESNVGDRKEKFQIGELRYIYVNPDNPEEIWEDSRVVPLVRNIFLAIGIGALIVGVAIIILI